jgi:hypothetical protein
MVMMEESLSPRPAERPGLTMAWREQAPLELGIARPERRADEVCMAMAWVGGYMEVWNYSGMKMALHGRCPYI